MFKKVLPLSTILFLRFLGLFLVLPVLSIYALSLDGATPFLVGVIVGGYALTQAAFQIPFGAMSDKIGRKPTLFVGLVIFMIGSIVAGYADNIYTLMVGRFLQGAGAIGSVVVAMIADLVEEKTRAHAMAIMGGFIAMSFAVAMVAGPVLGGYYGVGNLFYITAGLSLLAMILLFAKVPTPPKIVHIYSKKAKISEILKDKNLFNMVIVDSMQKGLMTMAFVLIPVFLTHADYHFDWQKAELWKVYVPAMILGIAAMGPAAIFGEKYNKPKTIFLIAIVLFIVSFTIMGLTNSSLIFVIGVICFFIAFNMMEPLVQSMISKFAKVHQKGTALGIANTSAYLSTFVGATVAGIMLGMADRSTIGLSVAAVALLWLGWMFLRFDNPTKHAFLFIPLSEVDMDKLKNLEHEHIAEWYINDTEKVAAIKYASEKLDEDTIKAQIIK
ncbi:putative transporter (MFS family) [hydrothermal vent metagenome]|uniref:Putative transporter (MFS family) n=1 Tax=hydrothermal vent metagenome TaxID=652676 RepID=A0A1W1CE34_9ZZZZ